MYPSPYATGCSYSYLIYSYHKPFISSYPMSSVSFVIFVTRRMCSSIDYTVCAVAWRLVSTLLFILAAVYHMLVLF